MIRSAFRYLIGAGLLAGLAACHSAPPSSPYPAGYSLSPYRQPGESAQVSDADRDAILTLVTRGSHG